MNHLHRFYDWGHGLGTKQFPSGYNIGCKIVMEKGQRILLRVSRPINHRTVFFHCWLFRNLLLFLREMILRILLAPSLCMCGDKVLLLRRPVASQGRQELSACQGNILRSGVVWTGIAFLYGLSFSLLSCLLPHHMPALEAVCFPHDSDAALNWFSLSQSLPLPALPDLAGPTSLGKLILPGGTEMFKPPDPDNWPHTTSCPNICNSFHFLTKAAVYGTLSHWFGSAPVYMEWVVSQMWGKQW